MASLQLLPLKLVSDTLPIGYYPVCFHFLVQESNTLPSALQLSSNRVLAISDLFLTGVRKAVVTASFSDRSVRHKRLYKWHKRNPAKGSEQPERRYITNGFH